MRGNNPVISTAKARGLIKKNGINYVDATRRLYPSIAKGISVWQLCDSVLFQIYGNDIAQIDAIEEKFANILAAENLTFKKFGNSYEIVKVNA
jgi:hypothetical protein